MARKTTYFKATTKAGRTVTRSTQTKDYKRAFVPDQLGYRSNWATAHHIPPEVKKYSGEICDAVEITRKEYMELQT